MHWTCAELTRRVSHTPESDDQAERWQWRSLLPLRTYSEYDWQAVRLVALQNPGFHYRTSDGFSHVVPFNLFLCCTVLCSTLIRFALSAAKADLHLIISQIPSRPL